jgi:4-alpha-glucanotransferase
MDLFDKAKEYGIVTEFTDVRGYRRVIDVGALKHMLRLLPKHQRHPFLHQFVVIRSDHRAQTALGHAARLPVRWTISNAREVIAEGVVTERLIVWPRDFPVGCYRLHLVDASGVEQEAVLVAAPQTAFAGDFDRCWLLSVQLYGIRSGRNWGIGDFTDLKALIDLAGHLGADGVGLNPLHVLFDDRPFDCSPYSPNSRLFLNPLYIDLEQIPGFEFRDLPGADQMIARLRDGDVVDYGAVADLKWRGLRSAFDTFRAEANSKSRRDFQEFRAERAPVLTRFACFEMLRHKFNKPWWEWPEDYKKPDDAKLARLGIGPDGAEIEFFEFVQWSADRQLQSCSERASRLGMKVGLYLDVAVGVQSDGFDAWNEQLAISRELAVGAPPDALNTAGQDWGLAGFNAAGLETRSFEPFQEMLRASMRYAGSIRLDHVLGLKRLYLIPHGFGPDNGAYVQMPFEALLALTAVESVTHRCVVIGEDLGTVPEGFREQMADWGIWSYKVMIFERDEHGAFVGIDDYAADALVTFSTHDLSTYAGWRSLHDLKIKRTLGIEPGESEDARRRALTSMSDVLNRHGIERDDFYAAVKFLSRTRSRLLAISLEDLLGIIDQPNLPGTVNEHPNWRRRLPVAIEGIASEIDMTALKNATEERRAERSGGFAQAQR